MIVCRRKTAPRLRSIALPTFICISVIFFDAAASAPSTRRPALLFRKRTEAATTEDHAAVSFLFDSMQSRNPRSSSNNRQLDDDDGAAEQLPSTRVRKLAEPFVHVLGKNEDSIDFPHLLSACRSFAEAMMDVGQNLSARDMQKNILKAQRFFHNSPEASKLTSMRAILQLEKDQQRDVHTYGDDGSTLIRLGEESCAMGLLWIKRSIQFQYLMFQQLVKGLDPDDATHFAYENSLRDYHGWALQKLYSVGLKSSSGTNRGWMAQLGGFDESRFTREQYEATKQDLNFLIDVWRPLLAQWESIYRELNIDEQRRV